VTAIAKTRTAFTLAALVAVPAIVWAQAAATTAKPGTQAPLPTATAGAVPSPQPPQDPYSYSPDGRRDPFVSLVTRGIENASTGKRGDGLANIATNQLLLRGVMQSKGAYFALVQSPDGKTYTAHANDRLADGVIRSVTPQGLVIMQEVNDPLSLIKQKEVRKGLRASDDVKQ